MAATTSKTTPPPPPPPQPFKLRKGTPADAPQIATLGAKVFSQTFGHSVTPLQLQTYLDESYTTTSVTQDLTSPLKTTIVATDATNDDILGFSLLTQGSSEPCVTHLENAVELQRIYVRAESHGRGVGRALATATEAEARRLGFRHIWLGVWEENLKAKAVYDRLGYAVVGDHVFDVGGDLQTDLIMVKEL